MSAAFAWARGKGSASLSRLASSISGASHDGSSRAGTVTRTLSLVEAGRCRTMASPWVRLVARGGPRWARRRARVRRGRLLRWSGRRWRCCVQGLRPDRAGNEERLSHARLRSAGWTTASCSPVRTHLPRASNRGLRRLNARKGTDPVLGRVLSRLC